jgi:hypothetical protein
MRREASRVSFLMCPFCVRVLMPDRATERARRNREGRARRPRATDTLRGIVAAAVLLLDRDTTSPPDGGAAAVRVTIPCAEEPPVTLVGLTDTLERAVGAEKPTPCRTCAEPPIVRS